MEHDPEALNAAARRLLDLIREGDRRLRKAFDADGGERPVEAAGVKWWPV